VIGIEISPELSEMAEKNVRTLRGRKAPVEIKNLDAALADFSEGNIFYMNNPFGEKTLRSVLGKIELSHKKSKNPTTVIYVNPIFSKVFEDFPGFNKIKEARIFTNLRIVIYKTKY